MQMPQTGQQIPPRNADTVKLAKGAFIILVGRLVGRATSVLGQVVIARLLGPHAFGLYAIGWAILRIVSLISPLGLDKGVIRYAPRYWRTDSSGLKAILFQSVGLAVLSGMLIGIIFFLLAPWLAVEVFKKPDLTPVIRWFSLSFFLATGLRVAAAATQVSQQMQYAVSAEAIIQPATNLCLVLFFYMIGWRLLGAVAAGVISFGLAFILAVSFVKHLFPEVFSSRIKSTLAATELLVFSLPAALAGACNVLLMWVSRLQVGYFRPASEVGIYQAASQSAVLFGIIISAFVATFSPMIANLQRQNDMKQLDELFKVSTKWGLYLSLPLFWTICFVPREIMTVVFGSQYEGGSLPLVIVTIGQFLIVGTGAAGFLLIMTGHQNRWFLISAVMFVVNIILGWLMIPRLGLPGAALALSLSTGVLYLLGLLQAKSILEIWPYDKRYVKGLIAAVLTIGALLLLRTLKIPSPTLNLFLTVALSIGVSGAALLLLGLDTEDLQFIRLVRVHSKR